MAEAKRFGDPVAGWTPPPAPAGAVLEGRYVRLEPMEADLHAADLHRAYSGQDALWDYMPYGPFSSAAAYHRFGKETASGLDPHFYVMRDLESGQCGGVASYLRITPAAGSIEVGHICLSPEIARGADLDRGDVSDDAMGLSRRAIAAMSGNATRCNMASRRAAQRLGFSYEGIFRQAVVVKGRNRDTAWFAVIDKEWPALREAYRAWLAPSEL